MKNRQEQAEIFKEERSARHVIEDGEFMEWHKMQQAELKYRKWLTEELRRREEEAEAARIRQEEEERRRKEEEEEARRIQEEEERRRQQEEINRQKEEAMRKRKELEERRKAEQQRMKEERERQRRAEEEAEALRQRLALEEEGRPAADGDDTAAGVGPEAAEERVVALRQQQSGDMSEFLVKLAAQVEQSQDLAALEAVLAWSTKEMGSFMSSFAFYIGLLGPSGHLAYKYASETCSSKLRAGDCSLDHDNHIASPTMTTVIGKSEEVFVCNFHTDKALVLLGDGALLPDDQREGDFFGVPLAQPGRCFGVLGADTLTCNGGRDTWQEANPEPNPNARAIEEPEKQFLREVAKLLSEGLARLMGPSAEAAESPASKGLLADLAALEGVDCSLGKVMATGLEGIATYLEELGVNAYISVPDRAAEKLSVVYQFAGGKVYSAKEKTPDAAAFGRHSCLIGKQLASTTQALSFGLFGGDRPPSLYCADVSQSETAVLYGSDGTKQPDCLFVAAIPSGYGSHPFAVLGVEASADPGLSQDQRDALLKVAQLLGTLIAPIRTRLQTTGICKQVLQWLEATTGVRNVYVSVPSGTGLRYVAANKGNEILIGKTLPSVEGVSHGVWDAEHGEVFIEDLKENAENAGRVKFFVEEHKGQPGQCFFIGVKGEDGTPLAVLGCDTLGGGKAALSNEDRKVFRKSAAVLAGIFTEISNGTLDDLTDEVSLQIEELVGAGGVRFYKKILLDVLAQLAGLTKDQLLEVARYNSPPELVVKVVSATLIVLQHKPKKVKEWDACRKHIKQPLIGKMKAFDATKEGKKRKNFFRRGKIMLKGLDMEVVHAKGSLPASLFFQWSFVSIQLRYLADLLRKQAAAGLLDLGDDEESKEDDGNAEDDADDDDDDDDGETTEAETAGEQED